MIIVNVAYITLLFYAINIDTVTFFIDSSFFFLSDFEFVLLDILYQFE
jgi:hypothetical protein